MHSRNLIIVGIISLLLFSISCKGENSLELQSVPSLATATVTELTQSNVSTGGNITSDGGDAVTVRGVCWSISTNPTIADSKTTDGRGTGSFTSTITGLAAATKYYVRAYAINSKGTGYGNEISFTTLASSKDIVTGTFKDLRDGKTYKTVKIGSQIWMAENLAYKPSSGNYWAYGNDSSNVAKYGYLYDWQTAINACPAGWHLASDSEWTVLTNIVGSNPGTKLKAKSGWLDNGNGTDDYGFTALPGGNFGGSGVAFERIGGGGYFWSSTENSSSDAWGRGIASDNGNVGRGYDLKKVGSAVRCLKDN